MPRFCIVVSSCAAGPGNFSIFIIIIIFWHFIFSGAQNAAAKSAKQVVCLIERERERECSVKPQKMYHHKRCASTTKDQSERGS
jgi:hypothetical protein